MARSTGIQPKSGYNFVLFDYMGPQTVGATQQISDSPLGGTTWMSINHTSKVVSLDTISEYTAGSGTTVNSVRMKSGAVRLTTNTALQSRNAANSGDVSLISLDATDQGQLGSTAFKAIDYSASVAAAMSCSGAMTIGTISISAARYMALGALVFFEFNISFTLAGTPSNEIRLTLPIAGSGMDCWAPIAINSDVLSSLRIGLALVSTTTLKCYQPDQASNWALGAGQTLQGQLWYWR